jgi:hypothetical protein
VTGRGTAGSARDARLRAGGIGPADWSEIVGTVCRRLTRLTTSPLGGRTCRYGCHHPALAGGPALEPLVRGVPPPS